MTLRNGSRRMDASQTVRTIFRELSLAWGPQHWWPAETPFEVVVGAILTQKTSWTNVERALANLRAADALSVAGIRDATVGELAQLIRPSGYFRQKAARLKGFVALLDRCYGGSLELMLARPTAPLREELLAQKGIGPETADSILLYAGQHPIFVADAYTRRILERHEAIGGNAGYDEVRELVEAALKREDWPTNPAEVSLMAPQAHTPSAMSMAPRNYTAQIYNEMHGLFVQLGKHYCTKSNPRCEACLLGALLPPLRLADSLVTKRSSARRRSPKPGKARL